MVRAVREEKETAEKESEGNDSVVSRKKIKVPEKVEKSRSTVFYQ